MHSMHSPQNVRHPTLLWRFVILIPFVIEIYKLIGLFDTSTTVIDETNYISSLPVTLPVIILVLFVLRRDYQIRIQNKILLDLDSEINLIRMLVFPPYIKILLPFSINFFLSLRPSTQTHLTFLFHPVFNLIFPALSANFPHFFHLFSVFLFGVIVF